MKPLKEDEAKKSILHAILDNGVELIFMYK